jgi:ATP-dependent DNA helicase PIF1
MLITQNLWKEAGLTNGAKCQVEYIIYLNGKSPPELPDLVIVKVPQYKGPVFRGLNGDQLDDPQLVPIAPVTRTWTYLKKTYSRTMLPLLPGYAISIHKSQGMSLDCVIINLGNREFAYGLTYTSVSRCREFENLAFDPFPSYQRFRGSMNSKKFKQRLKEDAMQVEQEKTFREKEL